MTVLDIRDPEAMHELGVKLGQQLRAGDLLILTGPLGAGKTTLTRGIGEGLGVRGPVQSPTFVLARTHPSLVGGAPLVHLDAYRLNDASELDDLDIDFDGSVVVAEWGAGLAGSRDSWIELVIERPLGADDDDDENADAEAVAGVDDAADELIESRTITLTGYGPRWEQGFGQLGNEQQSIEQQGYDERGVRA